MSLSINDISDQFLTKLREIFPKLEVDHYPGNPDDYIFTHPIGAVLLIYRDRRFQRPTATDGTIQVNEPVVWMTYFSRNLRRTGRNEGIYDFLERGRNGLAGQSIGIGNIWIRREFQVTQKNGIWIYAQEWVLEDVYIPEEQ